MPLSISGLKKNERLTDSRAFRTTHLLIAHQPYILSYDCFLDADVKIQGQENAYKEVIKTAVGGAAGVIHAVDSATTDCQPNENVEALRVFMLGKKVECRPVWKPMHKQPVYEGAPVYTNGVEEDLFKVGFCLPAGPYVSDDDVRYIVDCIKEAIARHIY